MKRFIYILLAGLAVAGLASCEKQELKTVSSIDVFSVFIEENLQTKATVSLAVGETHTFYATLKKNGIPVNCSGFEWKYPSAVSNIKSGSTTRNGVTAGYLEVKGSSAGSGNVAASTAKSNTGGVEVTSNNVPISVKGVESLTFTLAKTELVASGNTTYTVTVKYTDGSSADVTSSATVTSSNPSMLSVSGNTVTSNKQIGCLGTFTLTASYSGKTALKDITVNTDYKSDDIKLSWSSDVGRSGEASSGTLSGYVKRNDASQVTVSFSGNLKTSNNDNYYVSNSFIELYVKDKETSDSSYSKASTSNTYRAEEGDGEVYELRYLGEPIKTWTVNWNAY